MGKILLIGDDGLARRTLDGLHGEGYQVEVLCSTPRMSRHARELKMSVRQVTDLHEGAETTDFTGLEGALILPDDEVAAIGIALAVEDHAPDLPMVLRVMNTSTASGLQELLGHCRVLSSAELAAPSFVNDALLSACGEKRIWRWASPSLAGWALLTCLTTLIGSAYAFSRVMRLSFVDATFVMLGFADPDLLHNTNLHKGMGLFLALVAALTIGALFALITDQIVKLRLARELDHLPIPTHDHVIVCGLGNLGVRVLELLYQHDVPCVGLDCNPQAPGVQTAKHLGIPVRFGEAGALVEDMHLDKARSVLAITDDDAANLRIGLRVARIAPELRVAVRCFDSELARRLNGRADLLSGKSVSAQAAPHFVQAAISLIQSEPCWSNENPGSE